LGPGVGLISFPPESFFGERLSGLHIRASESLVVAHFEAGEIVLVVLQGLYHGTHGSSDTVDAAPHARAPFVDGGEFTGQLGDTPHLWDITRLFCHFRSVARMRLHFCISRVVRRGCWDSTANLRPI
jgi:hypothetical protein